MPISKRAPHRLTSCWCASGDWLAAGGTAGGNLHTSVGQTAVAAAAAAAAGLPRRRRGPLQQGCCSVCRPCRFQPSAPPDCAVSADLAPLLVRARRNCLPPGEPLSQAGRGQRHVNCQRNSFVSMQAWDSSERCQSRRPTMAACRQAAAVAAIVLAMCCLGEPDQRTRAREAASPASRRPSTRAERGGSSRSPAVNDRKRRRL